jgi:hypothetical protein
MMAPQICASQGENRETPFRYSRGANDDSSKENVAATILSLRVSDRGIFGVIPEVLRRCHLADTEEEAKLVIVMGEFTASVPAQATKHFGFQD